MQDLLDIIGDILKKYEDIKIDENFYKLTNIRLGELEEDLYIDNLSGFLDR